LSFLQITENQSVLTVSLNRPTVRNAFNPEMINEITELFTGLNSRHDLRLVILKGEGKAFCAGGDLKWMQDMVHFSKEQNSQDSNQLYKMFDAIQKCEIPVLGVVHGAAFGGALGLVAACDQVICEDKTQFCFSEVKLGIAPAVISSFILRKSSLGFVMPYMLSAKVFNAQDALRMGLVHQTVEEETLQDLIEATVHTYLQIGPKAARETKKLILSFENKNSEQIKEQTIKLIADLRTGDEGQEGLKSFLEKREPSWRPPAHNVWRANK
jgi:methylglutaconyl-CoA hydratase